MRPDRITLAFDTSAAHCAAALLEGDRILSARAEVMDRGQAERLMPFLQAMLADQGLDWRDLAALGVGVGPGNFTGVRIAVSAARGLALGLGIPALGVTGLQARAFGQVGAVRAAVGAPRAEVYAQDFMDGAAISPVWQGLPQALFPSAPCRAVGEGWAGPSAEAGDVGTNLAQVVAAMARIAARDACPDSPPPAPFYLRAADAAPAADPPPVILP